MNGDIVKNLLDGLDKALNSNTARSKEDILNVLLTNGYG